MELSSFFGSVSSLLEATTISFPGSGSDLLAEDQATQAEWREALMDISLKALRSAICHPPHLCSAHRPRTWNFEIDRTRSGHLPRDLTGLSRLAKPKTVDLGAISARNTTAEDLLRLMLVSHTAAEFCTVVYDKSIVYYHRARQVLV